MPGHGAISRFVADACGGPRCCLQRSNVSMMITRPWRLPFSPGLSSSGGLVHQCCMQLASFHENLKDTVERTMLFPRQHAEELGVILVGERCQDRDLSPSVGRQGEAVSAPVLLVFHALDQSLRDQPRTWRRKQTGGSLYIRDRVRSRGSQSGRGLWRTWISTAQEHSNPVRVYRVLFDPAEAGKILGAPRRPTSSTVISQGRRLVGARGKIVAWNLTGGLHHPGVCSRATDRQPNRRPHRSPA
jgi:hypothetical protein